MAARKKSGNGNGNGHHADDVQKLILDAILQLGTKIDKTNERLDKTNERLDKLIENIGGHYRAHEDRIARLENRLDALEHGSKP